MRRAPTRALVAVYGTLRRGQRAAYMLAGSRFAGRATLAGFTLYAGPSYPAIARGPGIVGCELYRVSRATLRDLDRYEGAPVLYRRERVAARLPSGRVVAAFAYVMDEAPRGWARARTRDWAPRPTLADVVAGAASWPGFRFFPDPAYAALSREPEPDEIEPDGFADDGAPYWNGRNVEADEAARESGAAFDEADPDAWRDPYASPDEAPSDPCDVRAAIERYARE